MPLEDITEETGLKPGETADALRSLEAANHASEGFRGWAVHLSTSAVCNAQPRRRKIGRGIA